MSNTYVSASFMLPMSWPSEAKDLFADLAKKLPACETEQAVSDLLKQHGISVDSDMAELILWDGFSLTPDIFTGIGNNQLPKEKWQYCFYDTEGFRAETTELLLQLIADKFKIPYRNRAEVGYCWSCDKPCVDEFGGDKIVAYHEPLKQACGCTAPDSFRAMRKQLAEENADYDEQIEELEATEETKDVLHLVRSSLFKMLDAGLSVLSDYDAEDSRILSEREVFGILKLVRCNMEAKEAKRKQQNQSNS